MVARRPAAKLAQSEADDRLLIEAAQKDPRRFGDLYEVNFARVYAFVASRVHDRDAAQDLTSDVFHRALANLGHFEWRGVPFAAWLLRIAANAIADRSEIAAREREREIPDPDVREEPSLEEIEHRARLFRLVDRLPVDQRRVILLRFGEQKTIREIAQELARSEGAVKQLQLRGLQNLRVRLGDR